MTHERLCFVVFDRTDIRRIAGDSGWRSSRIQPPLFRVRRLRWGAPGVAAGPAVRLVVEVASTAEARMLLLLAREMAADRGRQPTPLAGLALPDARRTVRILSAP